MGEGRQNGVREWEEKGGGTEWEKSRLNVNQLGGERSIVGVGSEG